MAHAKNGLKRAFPYVELEPGKVAGKVAAGSSNELVDRISRLLSHADAADDAVVGARIFL